VTGAAKHSLEQATKWVRTRYQFGRPLSEFELVQDRVARMAARTYAMDAMLYMVCGMLDRGDDDIMVETAACKVFCSEQGWNVIDDGMQIMGGEGYMTENEYERGWRDNRIHRIVEGSNEVMQSFIFAYGGKQLAEYMLGVLNAVDWDEDESPWSNLTRIASTAIRPEVIKRGTPLATEIFLGVKKRRPSVERIHPLLKAQAAVLGEHVQAHTQQFKLVSRRLAEEIVTAQKMQSRLADNAILMFAMTSVLSKLDMQLRRGEYGPEFERDKAAALHFLRMADLEIRENVRALNENADKTMRIAAAAQFAFSDTLPNEDYYIHETSPSAKGTGKPIDNNAILQFPGEAYAGDGNVLDEATGSDEPAGDGAPAVERS
jgi:acyl-CoA dehydrogenase family member 9